MSSKVTLARINTSAGPVSVDFMSSILADIALFEPQDLAQIRDCILSINDDDDTDDLYCLLQNLRFMVKAISDYRLLGQDRTSRNARALEIATEKRNKKKSSLLGVPLTETDGA